MAPYWFIVLLIAAAMAAAKFRRPCRFSVRGLLIAVSFLACLIGMATALDRYLMPLG
jgi:hypothetical protein